MAIDNKIPSPSEVKSAPVSFSQEELNEIRDLRTELNQITFQLGQIKINKIRIENSEILIKKELFNLEEKESKIAKKLSDKYGKGSIDVETGTFIPAK
jgi:hypothetical protein|tara:strand:- start:723 stop:1016 length:294 start_codon:yes stop_codon:yes gene_type:complete